MCSTAVGEHPRSAATTTACSRILFSDGFGCQRSRFRRRRIVAPSVVRLYCLRRSDAAARAEVFAAQLARTFSATVLGRVRPRSAAAVFRIAAPVLRLRDFGRTACARRYSPVMPPVSLSASSGDKPTKAATLPSRRYVSFRPGIRNHLRRVVTLHGTAAAACVQERFERRMRSRKICCR